MANFACVVVVLSLYCCEQLQGLFSHSKIPSLLNPATHTFKMAQWADHASTGEGDMGTNVVWMYPQVQVVTRNEKVLYSGYRFKAVSREMSCALAVVAGVSFCSKQNT